MTKRNKSSSHLAIKGTVVNGLPSLRETGQASVPKRRVVSLPYFDADGLVDLTSRWHVVYLLIERIAARRLANSPETDDQVAPQEDRSESG